MTPVFDPDETPTDPQGEHGHDELWFLSTRVIEIANKALSGQIDSATWEKLIIELLKEKKNETR